MLNPYVSLLMVIRSWLNLPLCCLFLLFIWQSTHVLIAQDGGGIPPLTSGRVSGSFQAGMQFLNEDKLIGAQLVKERTRMSSYGMMNYNLGGFNAGLRYEANLPAPLLGINESYAGRGIANRYLNYTSDRFAITVGNFYEQFGMGMAYRSWWEPLLGFDTSLDGVKLWMMPIRGVEVKGTYGSQRKFWAQSTGIVRGADVEVDLADLLDTLWRSQTRIRIGGSFVSKYEPGDSLDVTRSNGTFRYAMPLNVGIFSLRANITRGPFILRGEFAQKENDPNTLNNFIYRKGQALFVSAAYTKKGYGASLEFKRLDNMDLRAERSAVGQVMQVNYLPPIARQHTLRLPTLYLYATQPNGEIGVQGDVFFKIPKNTLLGGPYGTTVALNFSHVESIDTTLRGDDLGYDSPFLRMGRIVYYNDFNVEVRRRLSKNWKGNFSYINLRYDRDQMQGFSRGYYGVIQAHVFATDLTYSINDAHSIRAEVQWMKTNQVTPNFQKRDMGDWVMALVEYNISPKYSFILSDEYNYNSPHSSQGVHYYSAMLVYLMDATRISLSYGRVREGINCAGGVCVLVPAMNGLYLSVNTSF